MHSLSSKCPACLALLKLKLVTRTPERELHAICTELVLNSFVCAAIVSPEAHGVVDGCVSYIARFNLIQVAQIVQMLCLAKYQEVSTGCCHVYHPQYQEVSTRCC